MISASTLRQSFASLGYRAESVLSDYQFAAVNIAGAPVMRTTAAAFYDDPPSYRNAAIGVVDLLGDEDASAAIEQRRALGAPFFITISKERLGAWIVTPQGATNVDTASSRDWDAFMSKHRTNWDVNAVRRAKAIQLREPSPQQFLFDPSVIHALQGQVQQALADLLERFLACFNKSGGTGLSIENDYRVLFPLVFRMLAGKILLDRDDKRIEGIDGNDARAVVDFVSQLYSLPPINGLRWNAAQRAQLEVAWRTLLDGLYVRNVAADDLAFVYENTLITPDVRRALGTHSTPAAVAEYVVRSLRLPEGDALQSLRVYEPFAGSCVFLTAAMRRFKELLPAEWTAKATHEHLITHFAASELDQFASEIARLSLILADYPNPNGWHIHNEDLFDGSSLARRLRGVDVVLCNPPFEDFDGESPSRAHASSVHKPIEALESFIEAGPRYLGIVMPQGFASHGKYQKSLTKVLQRYEDVELLTLPENTFAHAAVGAVVLVAQRPRSIAATGTATKLRRSSVARKDLQRFKQDLRPSLIEEDTISCVAGSAALHLNPLREVWEYLQACPRLGQVADVHRGLEWNIPQSDVSSPRPAKGKKPGLHRLRDGLDQFRVRDHVYLETRQEFMRGGAWKLPWGKPKVICSAIRRSRGPWRIAAATDTNGLLLSQQFFGIWPKSTGTVVLNAISAVLNSPVANAYSFTNDPEKGLRIGVLEGLPLPKTLADPGLIGLIDQYVEATARSDNGPLFDGGGGSPVEYLMAIDAAVLAAYDLPPRLEKRLLAFMGSGDRPCGHPFPAYPNVDRPGAISLQQRLLSGIAALPLQQSVWAQVLAPLPAEGADFLEMV